MVICFTKHLLDAKQQLSKIWLAAHWEKKIKRTEIFKVDIEKCVQEIVEAEVQLIFTLFGLFKTTGEFGNPLEYSSIRCLPEMATIQIQDRFDYAAIKSC